MSDVFGVLFLLVVGVVLLVVRLNQRPEVVAERRHDRFTSRFGQAQTASEQVRHAQEYLAEVCRSIDSEQVLSKVAAEVYAVAAKRNGTPTQVK